MTSRTAVATLAAAALCAAPSICLAAACSAASPAHTVALVELYTSEGCSSCPPADRWLSRLTAAGYDDQVVIPLAMHVTYWDYIGWKDRYARAEFTERQRAWARLHGASAVYTPQVVLSGADFPHWDSATRFAREVSAIADTPARATIELTAAEVPGGAAAAGAPGDAPIDVTVRARTASGEPATLYVATYESGLGGKVTRGENAGATLAHDFVARGWRSPQPLVAGRLEVHDRLPATSPAEGSAARSRGVVAFVQDAHGRVLQATACALR